MRFQSMATTCGAAAILNALCALEQSVTEDQVVSASGVKDVTKGLGVKELKRALASLGRGWSELHETREPHGWLFLRDALQTGRPVILAVDADEHWVAAVGLLGPLVQVADGAHPDLVFGMGRADLMRRWAGPGRRPYYGLVVESAGERK